MAISSLLFKYIAMSLKTIAGMNIDPGLAKNNERYSDLHSDASKKAKVYRLTS